MTVCRQSTWWSKGMTLRIVGGVCIAAAVLVATGCASTLTHRAAESVATDRTVSEVHLDEARSRGEGYLSRSDRMWIGGKPRVARIKSELPPHFAMTVNLKRQVPMTLQMIAEVMSRDYDQAVHVTQDAIAASSEVAIDPLIEQMRESGAAATAAAGMMFMHYEGSLKGLLDQVTARTSNAWRYDEGTRSVTIFHLDTQTFALNAIAGSVQLSAEISNTSRGGGGGSGGGGGGGGQGSSQSEQSVQGGQSVSRTVDTDLLTAASTTVETMLSEKGRMSPIPGASAISVTDTPAVLARVGRYVNDLNERMGRQVAVDVTLYNVQIMGGESFGLDWSTVYQRLSGRYGVRTLSSSMTEPGAAQMNMSVLDPQSAFNGSQLLVQALATQGDLSTKRSTAIVTLSGQPAPFQIGSDVTYLASSDVALVSNAGAIRSSQAGVITTGFSMMLLPIVTDDNEVLLQFSISQSDLRELRVTGSGDSRQEMPNVDMHQLMHTVRMRSGSTLVLSGFESDSNQSTRRGVGSPRFWLAGGGSRASRERTVQVLVLTPRVL